ncbi:MAG TPA: hypothetical protein VF588_08925 [Pyrinomonadaceae bacterium]|jgi:hypothetical protein
MEVRRARKLSLLPWLSLPAVLLGQLALWGRTPPDVAVHFTPAGRPVTLMSRAGFLLLSVAVLLALLIAGTRKLRASDGGNTPRTLLRYYFAVAVVVLIYFGLLIYNVTGRA